MNDRTVYRQVSALLDDYLQSLRMLQDRGPLRVLREVTRGIVFTASVQLSNAARLWAPHPWRLRQAVDRLSGHLADPGWDHHEWAAAGAWADWALAHRPERGRAVTQPVSLPIQDVPQYGKPPRLWLVVPTYTFGDGQRWLLLTCGLVDQHLGPRQVRYHYALRWRAEDGKRSSGRSGTWNDF
jgi:hypothetical protein